MTSTLPFKCDEAIALYQNAPCGYVTTSLEGTILRANETFTRWIGQENKGLRSTTNLRELLTTPSRIFYDTHYTAILQLQGSVSDISLELLRPGQTSLPVIVTSVLEKDDAGRPFCVRSTLFDITERRRYEHDLIAAKRQADTLADVVRYSETAIITASFDLEVKTWNAAAAVIFADVASPLTIGALLGDFLPSTCLAEFTKALETATPASFEHRLSNSRFCRISAYFISDGLAIFLSDITRERASQHALQRAHDRFTLATMATSDGIWDWDCATGDLYSSGKIQAMLGLQEKAAVMKADAWMERVHPKDAARVHASIAHLHGSSTDRFENEYRVRHEDGSWRWVHNRGMALRGESGDLIRLVGSHTDITARKIEDSLTRLHTRLSLLERLEWRLATEDNDQNGCALLFIDLDGFKRVNDGFGHTNGDLLLVEVARRMEYILASDPKSLAARLGGDEFVVLLDEVSEEQEAISRAQEIHQQLEKPILCGDHQVTLSASIGIALSRPRSDTAEDLLRNADVAMYRAKAAGRAKAVVFSESMRREVLERLDLEGDLRKAMQNGELVLHYQPKVVLQTGRVIGFEALGRWKHATRGMVSPDLFIGIAEESDLICEIGRWTLRESIRQLSRWRKDGIVTPATTMAVNLSPKQFGDRRLLEILVEELEANQLPASCIEVEITEGVLIGDAEEALRVLQQLKTIGVGLELDDFGKGYSSLSYLHRFPFSSLKVDRAFVSTLGPTEDGSTITRTIIALGQALGLEVIAEGIETEDQLHQLRSMGCPFGQGYLFSKPLAAQHIEAFLQSSGSSLPAPVISAHAGAATLAGSSSLEALR